MLNVKHRLNSQTQNMKQYFKNIITGAGIKLYWDKMNEVVGSEPN